jgi:glycosyltransferase involved in cell wall biosynthesis
MPLFSVLVTNYNNGKYLEECLHSIFEQTYSNWEIIIVDDASTDKSLNIYKKYECNEKIQIFINTKNKGVGYSKHKCVSLAKGDICGFVDSDDTITNNSIELLTDLHLKNPHHSIIYSNHFICNDTLLPEKIADYVGQIPPGTKSWSIRLPVISHFATFKRANYLKTRGISSVYLKAADKDLYYKLEETGPVLFINKPLYYYRHNANSISLNDNVNDAYKYELTAKFMVVLRNDKSKILLKQIPDESISLLSGAIYVALKAFKNKNFIIALKLFMPIIYFSPVLIIKLLKNKIQNYG